MIAVRRITTSMNNMRQYITYFGRLCLERYTKYAHPMLMIYADSFTSCADIPNIIVATTKQKNLYASIAKNTEQSNLTLRYAETSDNEQQTAQKTTNKQPQLSQTSTRQIIVQKQAKLNIKIAVQQIGILQREVILFFMCSRRRVYSQFLWRSLGSKGSRGMRIRSWHRRWSRLYRMERQKQVLQLVVVRVKQTRVDRLNNRSSITVNIIGRSPSIFSYIAILPVYLHSKLQQFYNSVPTPCPPLILAQCGDALITQ